MPPFRQVSARVPLWRQVSGRLLRRIGVDGCLALVLGGYIARFAGYACLQPMPYTWWVLILQSLHGLTFGKLNGIYNPTSDSAPNVCCRYS